MCRTDVIGDDGLGVPRIVLIDMCDCRLHIRDHANRQDEVAVFRRPILLACRRNVRENCTRFRAAAQFYTMRMEELRHLRKEILRNLFVYQKGLCGIADRGSRNLCVFHNAECHRDICRTIHIDMTDAGSRLYDRDGAALDNAAN